MSNPIQAISDLLTAGGFVLWIIMFATFFMWVLIIERMIFFKYVFPEILSDTRSQWLKRQDKSSWFAGKVREALISISKQKINSFIGIIKTMVALCPLLGLLGTVTGMISVFDIMAVTGTGNARLMASGISMATIPTMAGMVAALSGLYFGSLFEKKAKRAAEALSDELTFE
jgi:biopolymer transport protein ExbB